MIEIGQQIVVGKGTVQRTEEVGFGGFHCWTGNGPRKVRITVILKTDHGGEGYNVDLAVGDRFEAVGQTWELAKISSSGPQRWGATLTRVA